MSLYTIYNTIFQVSSGPRSIYVAPSHRNMELMASLRIALLSLLMQHVSIHTYGKLYLPRAISHVLWTLRYPGLAMVAAERCGAIISSNVTSSQVGPHV